MRRDTTPDPGYIALATVQLMITGNGALHAADPAAGLAGAVRACRDTLGGLWPKVPPEAARDALIVAAEVTLTCGGDGTVPQELAGRFGLGPANNAAQLLALAGEYLASSEGRLRAGGLQPPGAGRPGFRAGTPHFLYASSMAFDRDEDDWTLSALAILSALAHAAAKASGDDARAPGASWPA